MGQPTLSRHIAALEAELGVKLFSRSHDGAAPTTAALSLRPQVEALAAAAETLLRAVSGQAAKATGTVRITSSEIVGVEVLPALLSKLQQVNRDITVELLVSNRSEDLLRREADIAVRMVRPTQGDLIAKRVGTFEVGLFADPTYLRGRPAPTTTRQLFEHALVGFDRGAPYTRTLQLDGQRLTREVFTLRSDNDLAQFAAIRAGCGIGACHVILAKRYGLTRVVPRSFAPAIEMWVVMHKDLRSSAHYKTAFDFLASELRTYLAG